MSTDGSAEWIRELVPRDGRVSHVRFARRAGLAAALDAGYRGIFTYLRNVYFIGRKRGRWGSESSRPAQRGRLS